jgi:hypothetical protein
VARPVAKKRKKRKNRPPRSKILMILLVFWAILALGVFSIYLSFYSSADRYLESGEAFVRALILEEESTLSNYIHNTMRGSLRSLEHGTVEITHLQGRPMEDADAERLSQELQTRYGLQESVLAARWIFVEYSIEEGGQCVDYSIEVLLANIGGDLFAVETRNLTDHSSPT